MPEIMSKGERKLFLADAKKTHAKALEAIKPDNKKKALTAKLKARAQAEKAAAEAAKAEAAKEAETAKADAEGSKE